MDFDQEIPSPPVDAIHELIEWHESTGRSVSYCGEIAPAMTDEEQAIASTANLLLIATGTPAAMATLRAIVRSVLP